MKKLLGIVVLGLFLSGNAYSKVINLICTTKLSKSVVHGKSQIDDISDLIEQVLVIDLSKKTVLDYGSVPGLPEMEYENIKVNNSTIEWEDDLEQFGYQKYVLNRISGQFTTTSTHTKESGIYKAFGITFSQTASDCKLKDKKF